MANLKFTNFGKARIAIAPVGTGGLTFTVEVGFGALFPVLGSGEYFYGVFKDASLNVEIVKIIARSVDFLTIETRGIDGTSARTWLTNDYFLGTLVNAGIQEFIPSVTTQAHGLTTLAADKLPYFDSLTTADTTDFTVLARTLLANATSAGMLSTLGAVSLTAPDTVGGKKTFSASIVEKVAPAFAATATTDLTAAIGNLGHITGDTGITAVTLENGKSFLAIFDGIPLLTHHATTLNLNAGGANYQVVAGDTVFFYAVAGVTYGRINAQNSASGGVPVGTIIDYAGASLPDDYIACDGASLLRAGTYADLFTAIGVLWGSVNGTTFNAPNLERHVTIGKDGAQVQGPGVNVGDTGGSEEHALVTGELAAHTHTTQLVSTGGAGFTGIEATIENNTSTGNQISSSSGSGNAHNNMQPSAVVFKCIKYR